MKREKAIYGNWQRGALHSGGLLLLMAVPILIIAGFQVWWLSGNYEKEKKNLELRSNITFRETVRRLQAKKLRLDKFINDTTGSLQINLRESGPITESAEIGEEVAGLLNNVTVRVRDSLKGNENRSLVWRKKTTQKDLPQNLNNKKSSVIISLNNSDMMLRTDSAKAFRFEKKADPPGEIIRFLYGVDSLQDSLRISEIDSAFQAALSKEKIKVSFTITRYNDKPSRGRPSPVMAEPNKITIGFAHPVTYEMKPGNTSWVLINKLISPILFSLFLVGVTVLTFALLYRNLQRQKKLADIKNEFISNITHELKTPIATVGVAIEALRNFNAINDPRRTSEYLDISQNELHRLSLLVDKVLKLSMFEKREVDLKFESINLKDIVDEVVSSMKLQIEKQHATVSVNQVGDTGLMGDKLHLLSVVFNLLDNALKYGNGNTVIKIEMKEKGNNVEFSVADNGIGISPEYKDKVFEKFFRVPAGDTHNSKGYGLGLSYVAHVVQKHNGKIEVESQPGIGTKFIITLPKEI